MTKRPSSEQTLAEAALRLIGDEGWQALTAARLARVAAIPLASVNRLFAKPSDIVPLLIRHVTSETAKHAGPIDPHAMPHDRLFEVMMARFDVLQAHRQSVLMLMNAARRDPALGYALMQAQIVAMRSMLDMARIDRPKAQMVLVAGLSAVYAATLCRWRLDEGGEMEKTMAFLDRTLRKATKLACLVFRED